MKPAALQAGGVDAALERGRVVLHRARREPDVADVAGEGAPEVLAVEQALDLALRAFVDVGALLVDEADLDAVGVVRREPDGDPALRPLAADLEARGRHGRELEVHHVHAAEVQAGDERRA